MNRRGFVGVLAGLLLWGCSMPPQVLTVPVKKLTQHDKLELLRVEAAKRHMQWRIWCIEWAEPGAKGFQAEAWRNGESSAHDDAWQLHDRWMKDDYTQGEAAYALYVAIQSDPTHAARKPEAEREPTRYHRICPVELSSTNHNEPCENCKIEVTP